MSVSSLTNSWSGLKMPLIFISAENSECVCVCVCVLDSYVVHVHNIIYVIVKVHYYSIMYYVALSGCYYYTAFIVNVTIPML